MQFSCNKHACGPHRNPSAHIVRSNLLIPTYNITRAYIVCVCVCVCVCVYILCVCVYSKSLIFVALVWVNEKQTFFNHTNI